MEFIVICYKVNAFFEQKNLFLKPKTKFSKKMEVYEYLKNFYKDKILCLKKPRTLGA